MKLTTPVLVAVMFLSYGCCHCDVPVLSPLPDDYVSPERYSPSTELKQGEITPSEAIAKAKKIARRCYGKTIDLNSAELFENPTMWIINFTDTKQEELGICPWNRIVGIYKKTGKAFLLPVE